jgi:hypothetical protein
MTIADVIANGTSWTNRFGSSACGRYQFMKATLQGLVKELGLTGKEIFNPDLQDRLGYHLLKRRKYLEFINGTISRTTFGNNLAMEWASFPVLNTIKGAHRTVTRGETYYSGDKLNKALIKPEIVEGVLDAALALAKAPVVEDPPVAAKPTPTPTIQGPTTTIVVVPPTPTPEPSWWERVLARLRAAYPPKA